MLDKSVSVRRFWHFPYYLIPLMIFIYFMRSQLYHTRYYRVVALAPPPYITVRLVVGCLSNTWFPPSLETKCVLWWRAFCFGQQVDKQPIIDWTLKNTIDFFLWVQRNIILHTACVVLVVSMILSVVCCGGIQWKRYIVDDKKILNANTSIIICR